MTKSTSLFLPPLDKDVAPAGADAPEWHPLGRGQDILKFARAVELYDQAGTITQSRIDGLTLPSPWARTLLFEHALLYGDGEKRRHPARVQIEGEWRGLLALIALSEELGNNKLSTRTVELAPTHPLSQMVPWSKDLGAKVDLILWDGQLVGATSPITLVFTGRRPLRRLDGIPFFEENADGSGRLTDPVRKYETLLTASTDLEHRRMFGVLTRWVKGVWETLETESQIESFDKKFGQLAGESTAASGVLSRRRRLAQLFKAWYEESADLLGGAEKIAKAAPDFQIREDWVQLKDPYSFLSPVQRTRAPGDVVHPLAVSHDPSKTAVVIDPDGGRLVDVNGNPVEAEIPVVGAGRLRFDREGKTSDRIQGLAEGQRKVGMEDLFQPKIVRAILRQGTVADSRAQLLQTGTGASKYFFPLNPKEVARSLDVAHLKSRISVSEDRGSVIVQLDIEVQGRRSIRFEKRYSRSEVTDGDVSSLWLWPNFERDSWTNYYWADDNQSAGESEGKNIVEFAPVFSNEADERAAVQFPKHGDQSTWGCTSRPVRCWEARLRGDQTIGLLLIMPPALSDDEDSVESVGLQKAKWLVSIDFGSTHTLAFVRTTKASPGDSSVPVPLKNRTVVVFNGGSDPDYSFFSYRNEAGTPPGAPTLLWAPSGSPKIPDPKWLPSDGIAFYGTQVRDRNWGNLYSNLKWRPRGSSVEGALADAAFKNYLSQLLVMIAAEAHAKDSTLAGVYAAYPGAFNKAESDALEKALVKAVGSVTGKHGEGSADDAGIAVRLPWNESEALESYLMRNREVDLGLFAVDVGGSTSDFVVRTPGKRSVKKYASIRLAGNIVNRVIARDDRAVETVKAALETDYFPSLNEADRRKILRLLEVADRRDVGAGLLMRSISNRPSAMQEFAKALMQDKTRGGRLLASVAYLFATDAFFMGLLAHSAEDVPRYQLDLAGRGALLLLWVSAMRQKPRGGEALFAHFFLAGLNAAAHASDSEIERPQVKVNLPSDETAKREVAIGLLHLAARPADDAVAATFAEDDAADSTELEPTVLKEPPIAESGFTTQSGEVVRWNEPLTTDLLKEITKPPLRSTARDLPILAAFVEAFQKCNSLGLELDIAKVLRVRPDVLSDPDLTERVRVKLFGEGTAWQRMQSSPTASADLVSVEPFFISAAKALLEHGLGVQNLFD